MTYTRNYGNGAISTVIPRTTTLFSDAFEQEDTYALLHENEQIEVVTDGEKIFSFEWTSPHEIIGEVNSNVKILEIEEIQSLCEKQLTRLIKGEALEEQFSIKELRMNNMYIRVKDAKSFYVLPVWDMIGYEYDKDGQQEAMVSLVTVNAIDGTVINRELGY